MFTNPSIQSTITQFNGNAFGFLSGFGMYSSPDTVFYYVIDRGGVANKVFILNDQWKFISFKVFIDPQYMISIGNSLYMTGQWNVWKVDQDLNILINYEPNDGVFPYYAGISYNPSNGLINVVASFLHEIQVFNLNLNLIRRFSTGLQPFSIAISSNQLYVGTSGGIILVYQNESLINQFNGCNGNNDWVESILFDRNGYMATACTYPTDTFYLFSPYGSFTGKSITAPYLPQYIGFDSKGRFIQISAYQINIYNLATTIEIGNSLFLLFLLFLY